MKVEVIRLCSDIMKLSYSSNECTLVRRMSSSWVWEASLDSESSVMVDSFSCRCKFSDWIVWISRFRANVKSVEDFFRSPMILWKVEISDSYVCAFSAHWEFWESKIDSCWVTKSAWDELLPNNLIRSNAHCCLDL